MKSLKRLFTAFVKTCINIPITLVGVCYVMRKNISAHKNFISLPVVVRYKACATNDPYLISTNHLLIS